MAHSFTLPFSVQLRKPFNTANYDVQDATGKTVFTIYNDEKLAAFVVQACNLAATMYSVECRAGQGWERIEAEQGETLNYPTPQDAYEALGNHLTALREAGMYFEDDDFRIVPVPGAYHQFTDLPR